MRVRWACHAHLAGGTVGVGSVRLRWACTPTLLGGTGGVGSVRVRWACHAHLARGYRGCGECAGEVGVSRPPWLEVPGVWGVCG